MLVLEPGNIEEIRKGHPLVAELSDLLPGSVEGKIMITFTPDMDWVREEFKKGGELMEVLQASLTRPDKLKRDYHEKEIFTIGEVGHG